MHVTEKELKKHLKKTGYKGCKNCSRRPPTSYKCDWSGEHHLHFICPKWKKVEE